LSRSQRLLDLVQLLRRHRHPVSGADIARELGISLRSLYRDVATLQAQGAPIEGAPGLGYVLRDGFTLPPLMFNVDEIEALVLGTRWVMDRGDTRLAAASTQTATGSVRIAVSPWGNVEVNGTPVGSAPPLNELTLPEGRHQIVIRNADFPPYSATISVSPGQPVSLKHKFGS
jgi:biotin operon repressor